MPGVSILTALHCFTIFPEDSGRRRQLIVVCSQWKVIGINILAALHCLNVANGYLFCFAHMLVGAWSSACPPGQIEPGKSWKCVSHLDFFLPMWKFGISIGWSQKWLRRSQRGWISHRLEF